MGKKKYTISYKRLMAMKISDESREEMIGAGIAEPDPLSRRIAEMPEGLSDQARHIIGDQLSGVEEANDDLDLIKCGVRLVLQIRQTKTEPEATENPQEEAGQQEQAISQEDA